jgi:4-hydroxy-4-methyl-2-oxoglutarate aldolase
MSAAVSSSRVERLRRLDACSVSDALDQLKLPGAVSGVPQPSGEGRIAGIAVTLKVGIGRPPTGGARHLGTTAIESADSDSIITIEQASGLDAGCWGGLLTIAANVRRIAGVVADGPVRDIDEARTYKFPIFTRQATLRTARGRVVELGTNIPVILWGVAVNPGDYVIADRSGIAFVSAADIDRVLDAAERIAAREAAMAKALLGGEMPSSVMSGNYENMLKP